MELDGGNTELMSSLWKEVESYDRNVESLSKFKLELYQQLEAMTK